MGSGQSKTDRLEVQRHYKKSKYRKDVPDTTVEGLVVFIVCAADRESKAGMFSATRSHFIDRGFLPDNIRRLHGVVPSRPRRGFNSEDMRKDRFLTPYFLRHFAPIAEEKLKEPGVEAVCWAEDDCRLKPDIFARDIKDAIRDAAPAASWLGYIKVHGAPRWGAHLIGFNGASLQRFVEKGKEFYDETPHALDTMLWKLLASRQRGCAPHVTTPPETMATQKLHSLKGRRLPA